MENVQAAPDGAHQQIIAKLEQVIGPITGNGIGVIRVVGEHLKVLAVIAVESVFGAYPEKAFLVLKHSANETLGETVFDGEAFGLDGWFVPGGEQAIGWQAGGRRIVGVCILS